MVVMEIELECDEFKVTSSKYGSTADDEGEACHDIVLLVAHMSPMQHCIQNAKPAFQWYSSRAWQDLI